MKGVAVLAAAVAVAAAVPAAASNFQPDFGFRTSAALKGRIRVQRGFGSAFRGYRDGRVRLFAAGRSWFSSDAEIVTCRIRVSSVTCRHYRGASFSLSF